MFAYLWWEKVKPHESKFGDHFVPAGENADLGVKNRIRKSLGVNKHQYDSGEIVIEHYWDVTDYAKSVGCFYKHGKVDDKIRPCIGHRKGTTGDFHNLPASEVKLKVDKWLSKLGQPLPVVGLSAWQARTARNVLDAIQNNKRTIVAELCARFGKTIWSGAMVRELNSPLTIIASYVLTSFTSFENDFSGFEQFKDLVLVDTADVEYQEIIDAALAQNKQVVAFLSLCNGTKRASKIKYLFGLPCNRSVILDEADFGAWNDNQATALIKARHADDTVILMTGTNADKAASYWAVDHYVSVVYPELLMEKRSGIVQYPKYLTNFDIDATRHKLVVDVEFYQMDLKRLVNWVRKVDQDSFTEDGKFLPSWSKFAANPVKAKGFWTRMLQSVFLAENGFDELNVDYQTNRKPTEGPRVAMMFLSGSMTNDNLTAAAELARQALPAYKIVPIYGETATNRTAESYVKEEIEKSTKIGQSVLLLSVNMAQRSFGVGDITELYLAYDKGDNGTTIQKISRALTPKDHGKIGRIISLSFDSNRDDKFDALILETALNYKKTHQLDSAKDALRQVLRTVDIFRCSEDGAVKFEIDDYLKDAIERNSLSRVIGKTCDLTVLSREQLIALAQGKIDVFRASHREVTDHGKTRDSKLTLRLD